MALNTSDREFVALGASIGAGCHPCTQYHTQAALNAGLAAERVGRAVAEARDVRTTGGIAVANVGRRILEAEREDLASQEPPSSRETALVRLGAAAGCNSGVLLVDYARHAGDLGLDEGDLREAVGIAEMVKTQAGKFLSRDVERALGLVAEPAVDAAGASAGCGGPEEGSVAVGAAAEAAPGGCGPACGCEEE